MPAGTVYIFILTMLKPFMFLNKKRPFYLPQGMAEDAFCLSFLMHDFSRQGENWIERM